MGTGSTYSDALVFLASYNSPCPAVEAVIVGCRLIGAKDHLLCGLME